MRLNAGDKDNKHRIPYLYSLVFPFARSVEVIVHLAQQKHQELRSIVLTAPPVHRVVPFHAGLQSQGHIGHIA